jgi:hypothetical protein
LLSTQCYQTCYRHNVIRLVIDTMLSDLLSTQCYDLEIAIKYTQKPSE